MHFHFWVGGSILKSLLIFHSAEVRLRFYALGVNRDSMFAWSFFYLYAIGGLFYFVGSILVIRAGMLDLKAPKDRNMYWTMTVCLILFALVHGYFQLVLAPGASGT